MDGVIKYRASFAVSKLVFHAGAVELLMADPIRVPCRAAAAQGIADHLHEEPGGYDRDQDLLAKLGALIASIDAR